MYKALNCTDLDDKPLNVDGDLDDIETVDLGAYERQLFNEYLTVIFR